MKKASFSIIFAVLMCFSQSVAAMAAELIPGGMVVGIELKTDGAMVSRLADVDTREGVRSPAREAGLKPGDCIVGFAGTEIHSGSDFVAQAAEMDGSDVSLTVRRDDEERIIKVSPAQNRSGDWQLGLWLRDGATGIGTVTYYDPKSGEYGALGHGVNDLESGELFPSAGGEVFSSSVDSVVKGQNGRPGELCGVFDPADTLGDIDANTPYGIFGEMEGFGGEHAAMETAAADEIKVGKATILSNLSGTEVQEYEVELTRVNCAARDGKNFLLKITDERLLEKTGGVVCGMSGSPIIQDGKLVGAVTHVLVNDLTRGYGIFIENMLDAAG